MMTLVNGDSAANTIGVHDAMVGDDDVIRLELGLMIQ
jgi:hypothetical protein